MTDKEALEYIEEKQLYKGIRKMDGLAQLCQRLGNPQKAIPVIGIAGISGRRSVAAYISNVLTNAGYRVGRYTEAISGMREHVCVKERPMTKKGLCVCLEQVQEAIAGMIEDGIVSPSPGAIETAIAYLYFEKKACEVVLWEVAGDVGSIQLAAMPTRLATVYTSMGTDDRPYVSDGLEERAVWQTGLMLQGGSIISAIQPAQVEYILQERAAALQCPFTTVDGSLLKKIKYGLEKQSFTYGKWERLEIGIGGNQEISNAALAVETLSYLERNGFIIKEGALRKGLLQTTCEECMHIVGKKPWFLIETVEHEEAALALANYLEQYFHGKRKIFILESLRCMEYDKIIRQIFGLAEHIITVTVREDAEGMHAYELAKEVQYYHPGVTAVDSPEEAVELAYLLADKETVVVAMGAAVGLGSLLKSIKNKNSKSPQGR